MGNAPLRIIQISDTHLYADEEKALLGVQPQKSFEGVIDLIHQRKEKFDLIIHSGDVSQDYSPQAYQRLADMLQVFNVPVHCVPGNHDDPHLMAKMYPRGLVTNERHILTKNWQIIMLDSHKRGAVEGYLNQDQLEFLQRCLRSHPEQHAIVLFHHHPVLVGCQWLDNLCLTNKDELWEIILQYPKVKNIVFGHVHQQYETVYNGINCYSVPSTCIQFMRNQNHFGLENLPPGYRWINLHEDGRFETGVVRTDKYIGDFDVEAKGY